VRNTWNVCKKATECAAMSTHWSTNCSTTRGKNKGL